jgi:diguanylate cyclase (GGDEF)-like protein/PAS domain S-box-containing protein
MGDEARRVGGTTEGSGAWRIVRDVEAHLNPQRKLIAELMHSDALRSGDVAGALQQVTEIAAKTLRVARASVWLLHDDSPGACITCADLYERAPHCHSNGLTVTQQTAPRYFAALATERTIAAHDARTDERTSEFATSYLQPLGITAMLDAPVFVRGKMVAVVCHEHVGEARQWHFWEELVAGTFADFVALVLEAKGWAAAERQVREQRDALERSVLERTAELRTSEESLRTLFDVSPVAMVLSRLPSRRVMFGNRRAYALFEVSAEDAAGLQASDFWVHPTQQQVFLQQAGAGRVEGFEAELRTRGGRVFWGRLSGQTMRFLGEDCLLVAVDDVTQQKAAEEQLRAIARRDSLTGVHNRRSLVELGVHELERARRYGRPFVAAMIDVDFFKRVNDEHGHAIGDEVLKAIVRTASDLLRGSDLLGRWGGEEFVVLLPETDRVASAHVLDRVRAHIAEHPILVANGIEVRVTISIGIAEWTGIESLESLVERADQACYAAKHAGRNRIELALPA